MSGKFSMDRNGIATAIEEFRRKHARREGDERQARGLMVASFTKIDAKRQEVWGVLTEEAVDKNGEILDYESSKPFFEEWRDYFLKATGGKSYGNLREMHAKSAVGKLIAMEFDDENKRILIGAKIVDPLAWRKVLEAVYTGFSVGGDVVAQQWDQKLGALRFTAKPHEASLADNPAQYGSLITVVKASGMKVKTDLAGIRAGLLEEELEMAKKTGKVVKEGSSEAGKKVAALKQFCIENELLEGDPATWSLDDMVSAVASIGSAPGAGGEEPPAEETPSEQAGEPGEEAPVGAAAGTETAPGEQTPEEMAKAAGTEGAPGGEEKPPVEKTAEAGKDGLAGKGKEKVEKTDKGTTAPGDLGAFMREVKTTLAGLAAKVEKMSQPGSSQAATFAGLQKAITAEVEKTVKAAQDALKDAVTSQLDEMADTLARIEAQPAPLSIRRVHKRLGGGPSNGEHVPADEDVESFIRELEETGTMSETGRVELRKAAGALALIKASRQQ